MARRSYPRLCVRALVGSPVAHNRRFTRYDPSVVSEVPRERTIRLLADIDAGDPRAADDLLPLVYEELRAIARRLLADQKLATLQPTELIHEAFMRLAGSDAGIESEHHFRRLAARAMRFVLVDRVRASHAEKRGGRARPATLDEAVLAAAAASGEAAADNVLAVHEALEALAAVDAQLAQIVELRFYGGVSMDEIADVLGVSRRTVQRGWRLARAWWIEEYAKDGEP